MEIQPISYEDFGQSVKAGLKGIASGIKDIGEQATKAYSQNQFRQYQKQKTAELKSIYKDGWQELVPHQYITPEQALRGVKNLTSTMAMVEELKKIDSTKLNVSEGTIASLSYYGDDKDVKVLQEGLLSKVDAATAQKLETARSEAIRETAEEASKAGKASAAYFTGAKSTQPLDSKMRGEMFMKGAESLGTESESQKDIKIANIKATADKAAAKDNSDAKLAARRSDKDAELVAQGWRDFEARRASLVKQREDLLAKQRTKIGSANALLDDQDPEAKKDAKTIEGLDKELSRLNEVRNIGSRDGLSQSVSFAENKRSAHDYNWKETKKAYDTKNGKGTFDTLYKQNLKEANRLIEQYGRTHTITNGKKKGGYTVVRIKNTP
jgi:hypothetical protein